MGIKNIVVPDIGGSTDVDVIEVLVKSGDHIDVDTPLLTLESDKATMEVPSSDAGTVKDIKIKVGDKVAAGSLILTITTEKSEEKTETKTESKTESKPAEKKSDTKTESTSSAKEDASKISADDEDDDEDYSNDDADDIHATPVVRRLAREFGIPLQKVQATGPKNRILKEDIQLYVKSHLQSGSTSSTSTSGLPSAPQVDFSRFGEIEVQALSRIKKLSGKNLHRNWLLVPHITQFNDADITELEDYRQSQKAKLEKSKIKLTPLVFIMKAVVAALKEFPQFNASLDGENLVLKKYFHIGVAVDTPDGLVVPVIRDVDKKGLLDLAVELAAVSEKARNKQLTGMDMQGGCFSISSLGGIGGTAFTPIINVPEVAILGVSKAAHKPVYVNGQFEPRLMLPLSLSYDHRVIDGADGARFIMTLSNLLSDIRNLLL